MKKVLVVLLCILTVCLVFAFTGCDYQESIDSARSDLMDSAKDMLDPFLNKKDDTSSSTNSTTGNSSDTSSKVDEKLDA